MEKGMRSKMSGIWIGLFLVVATIVGILGANNLIWGSSKLNLNYPRNDFYYELGEKPTQDLPVIKITSKEDFRKIQVYGKQVCYVEPQTHHLSLFGTEFSFLSIKFWTIADDVIFCFEQTQNLPLFRQIRNVELNLGDKMTVVLNGF